MSIDSHEDGLSRREFIRRGAMLGAAAFVGGTVLDTVMGRTALAGPDAALPNVSSLLTRDQISELLRHALSRGGDFAEVYAEYTLLTSLTVDQGKLSTMEYGVLAGTGIRVLSGTQVGYAYSDDFDMGHLREAALTAASIATKGGAGAIKPYRVSGAKAPFTLKSPAPLSLSERQKIDLLMHGDAAARGVDKRITQVTASWGDTARRLLVANSEGVFETDEQYVSRLVFIPLAVDGSMRQSGFESTGGTVEAGFYDIARAEALARKAAAVAVELLTAVEPKAGTYPVVIAPGWGGVLVHECFGHSLEGDGIRKKSSIRATQLGTQVAAKGVNIFDDGTVPNSRGSFRVDDEGTPSRKNQVVEDGVLRGFLWDRLNLKYADAAVSKDAILTGNGRRASYRDFPIPRMTNTYIAAGTRDPKDIISEVKQGLYCANMSGGSVNPADGNFSFACTLAYNIEDGKITSPVRDVTLTGNGADAMMKIDALGTDLTIDGCSGTCGKQGQSKPVGVGQPTVRFSGFTVGGTKT